MSINDIKAILNSPEVFLFLPTVNYVYLFATTNLRWGFILCCVAGIVCAIVYNILDGIPASNATEVKLGVSLLFFFSTFGWLLLLLHSAFQLYNSFGKTSVVHEFLFFTTFVFVTVMIINLTLYWYEEEYQRTI